MTFSNDNYNFATVIRLRSGSHTKICHSYIDADKKKPYAAFLIDRPSNYEAQGGDNLKVVIMNCLRYRLRIALALNLEMDTSSNSDKKL
jgi:hypothetical protein